MTSNCNLPKQPGGPGWVRAMSGTQGDTWLNADLGLLALSRFDAGGPTDASEFTLTLSPVGGGACTAALAFLALADFGLMSAEEVVTPDAVRTFRFR